MSPPTLIQIPSLTIADYSAKAYETDRFLKSTERIEKLCFGFFGEIGGLLAALKKVSRDQLQESETEVTGEEIGDALWYLVNIAKSANHNGDQLGGSAIRLLRKRFSGSDVESEGLIGFRNIDAIISIHSHSIESKRSELLCELAQKSGELIAYKEAAQEKLSLYTHLELLGGLLASLALVSASFNLRIEDIARDNLNKVIDRWPGKTLSYVPLFDTQYKEHEQLPRKFEIDFIQRETGHVVQRMNGVYIGDRLTDNSNEQDDYRFHDVFHLAYVAHLGWSPVIRSLLHLKRKSNTKVDENEDGARAAIIEEGIATWIFNHAKKRNFYENIEVGKLEYGVLKQIRNLVSGYEVDACPLWQWERAILEGFRIFRELRKPENRGGRVTIDMIEHLITYSKIS